MQQINHTAECIEHTQDAHEDNLASEFTLDQLQTVASREACGYDTELARRVRVALEDGEFCAEHGCA